MTTATALPPAAKATIDAVREGLADIRDRVSDMESMPEWERIAEMPRELIDRATGRQRRRPSWPIVALGVVAVIGLAVGVTMFMLNRSSMNELADELESDVDTPWTPNGTGSTTATVPSSANTVGTFPASDPMPSSMSPSIGG
jgi:hypothetical protein